MVGQAFDWIEGLQWRVGERIDDIEEEVRRHSSLSDLDVFIALRHIRPLCRETTVKCQHNGANERSYRKHLLARHPIREHNAAESSNTRCDRVSEIENELLVSVIADGPVDLGVEVAQPVTRELAEDTLGDCCYFFDPENSGERRTIKMTMRKRQRALADLNISE